MTPPTRKGNSARNDGFGYFLIPEGRNSPIAIQGVCMECTISRNGNGRDWSI